MDEAAVPGLSIAIVTEGKLLWRRAFGVRDRTSNVPVDHDTLFEAASTSKPLFAYAVMKLCERGIMDLDAPLTKYTPERVVERDPRSDLVTARQVLTHMTGLPNWRSPDEPLRFAFTPGERWSYSGEGFSYLQSVVTRLAGGRVNPKECAKFEMGVEVCTVVPGIDAYMKATLLDPFGMTSSGYVWTDSMRARMARGHDEDGKPSDANRDPSGPAVARYAMAGGLCTTPTDYAKFLIEVIDPKPADAFRLNSASRAEMLRAQIRRNPRSSWALGWEIEHTENGDFIRHGGGNPGFACFVAGSVVGKSGYVIMTNGENSGYTKVIAKLMAGDTLSQFLGGKLTARTD